MKRIILGNMNNVRDLGGYPSTRGYTKYLRFLRSDCPKGLTKPDYDFLLSNSITTIIDLRNSMEIELHPDPFETCGGFSYKSCPMFADGNIPDAIEAIPTSYLSLATTPDTIGPVLKAAAEAPSGVLFHCTAGKDRTGVVAAVLLRIAGVSKDDIMADYIATQAYLLSPYRRMLESNPEFPFFLTKADIDYIEKFIDGFTDAYPDIDAYIEAMGITLEEKEQIIEKLVK
ncbi:MAG: tyrosine-protein phosphatase [Clostridiaceae bacterium]|nr:tyrosine-protein phosphatase [Clostridiaceae bacterium]